MLPLESFAHQLTHAPPTGCTVRSTLTLSPTQDAYHPFPSHFPEWLCALLRSQGISDLTPWQHQALEACEHGNHVCVTAPAGSGRGIVRLLAMYQALGRDPHGYGLFIFPQKQRELAQLRTIHAWQHGLAPEHRLTADIYDGDTPTTQRRTLKRDIPHLVFTTPEMLHAGILAYHSGWRRFFQHLRYVVLTDMHACAGALVSHLGHVLRRLQRIAHHYGAQPQYLLTSAPLANAAEAAYACTGHTCSIITGTTRPQQRQHRVLLSTDRDLAATGQELLARYREAELPVLVFTSQPETLRLDASTLAPSADAYNDAELRLLQGEIRALVMPHDVAPTALRPGAVRSLVFLGLPASFTQLHTYLARLAYGQSPSMCLLIIEGKTPLEQYLLHYPAIYHTDWLQGLPTAFDNHICVRHHLLCAAAELALTAAEQYAGLPNLDDIIRQLVVEQALEYRPAARQWTSTKHHPHRQVQLRRYERPVALINRQDGRYLTSLPPAQAFRHCTVGGYYTHGDHHTFEVEHIETDRQRIFLRPSHPTARTRGHFRTTVQKKHLSSMVLAPTYRLTYGTLDYLTTLHAVERLDPHQQTRQSLTMVSGRTRHIRTHGTWLQVPDADTGVLHTLVHAVLAALPLLCNTTPNPLRGGVYADDEAEDTPLAAIFTDVDRGGNGTSAFMYYAHTHLLRAALHILLQCDCLHGCPRCVAGLQCDTCQDTATFDRQAGIALLQRILAETHAPLESVRLPSPGTSNGTDRQLYLCLTTQKSADEVAGWQHKHLLGLGLAMTYDTHTRHYTAYTAATVAQLVASMRQAESIIGFNLQDFDYHVLQPYTDVALPTLPTCAMLDDIQHALGYRVSRRHLVWETLGIDWPDERLETLQWYREGHIERLIQTCRRDLDLLRALAQHGSTTGTVTYRDRTGVQHTVSVPWHYNEDYA